MIKWYYKSSVRIGSKHDKALRLIQLKIIPSRAEHSKLNIWQVVGAHKVATLATAQAALDDRKRAVRAAAVRCRAAWTAA